MPKPLVYIPVTQSYRMPGPTLRLGEAAAGARRFEVDDEHAEYVAAKGVATGLWSTAEARSRLEGPVLEWLRNALARDAPELACENSSLDGLIAGIQEDVVIMHRADDAPAISAHAAYVNVCFPSGWCPPCTCGKSFVAVHAPVPNADAFDGPGRKAAAELLFRGEDAVRFVWSLTPDATLDRRSCHRPQTRGPRHESRPFSWEEASRLYLRVERQVISAIDANTACFLIRIYRYRLEDVDTAVRRSVYSSVATMPDSVKAYKGLAAAYEHILGLIDAG